MLEAKVLITMLAVTLRRRHLKHYLRIRNFDLAMTVSVAMVRSWMSKVNDSHPSIPQIDESIAD